MATPAVTAQPDATATVFATGRTMVTATRTRCGHLRVMVAITTIFTWIVVLSTVRTVRFRATPFRSLCPGGRSSDL